MNTRTPRLGLLVLASLVLAVPAAIATGNPWFDKYTAYETANGTAYTGSPDAAFIAWQEGMMLRSYLNLYTATRDTAWLTKFTDHVTTVMGSLNNIDGDAYSDWTTARYSPPITVNGLFKDGAAGDTTLPANWARDGTTSSATAFRTNAAGEYISSCNGDTWGLELVTNGVAQQRLVQTLTYQPNWRYELSIYGKNSGTAVHGRAFVYNHTTSTLLASVEIDSTTWKNHTAEFTTPAAGHVIKVWLAHFSNTPSGASSFFDHVRVAPHYAYQVLDGMIGIPLANFSRLVDQTPALQTTFGTAANSYQDFLENQIIAKWHDGAGFYGDTWVDASATEGYYKEPTTRETFENTTSFNPLPYNQTFSLIEIQNILFDLNASFTYLARAEKGATHFRNRLTVPAGEYAYWWYYAPFTGSKVEDASHVNVDMEFITEMHRTGGVFTDDDMNRFTATLTDNLWNGSITAPLLTNHVDGTAGGYCNPNQFTLLMYGWVPYAQFDPLAWTIAAKQYEPLATITGHTSALTMSQILLWDPVKLVNQGFELPASGDATLPARWTRRLSSATTAFRDSANKTSGDWGLTLVTNGTQWQKLTQPWTDYAGGVSYTVTFDGKVDTSGANGRVWIYNETIATTIAAYNFSNTGSWQTHSFTFTSPTAATNAIQIQLGHQVYTVNNGCAYFDNVVIKRTGDAW